MVGCPRVMMRLGSSHPAPVKRRGPRRRLGLRLRDGGEADRSEDHHLVSGWASALDTHGSRAHQCTAKFSETGWPKPGPLQHLGTRD